MAETNTYCKAIILQLKINKIFKGLNLIVMPSDANVCFNGGFKITFSISSLVDGSDGKALPAMRETQV